MLHEKYASAYISFLNAWHGAESIAILEAQFRQLSGLTFIPLRIRRAYDDACRILSDASSSSQARSEVCAILYAEVEKFIRNE